MALLLLAGCSTQDEVADITFGDSVRHQIALQTSSPGNTTHGLYGPKAATALEEYRKDVAKPKDVYKSNIGAVSEFEN